MSIPYGFIGPETAALLNVNDVRDGVDRGDGQIGTLELPIISDVLSGVGYGSNGTEFVGTASGGSGGTFPSQNQVLDGIVFGPTDNLTGNLELPIISDVLSGVGFGSNGTEFVGTASVSGTFPTQGQVLDGVVFGPTDNLTGNLELPSINNVSVGIGFGSNGTEFVGTASVGGHPDPSEVLVGVSYGNGLTGTVVLPLASQVVKGIVFGASNSQVGIFTCQSHTDVIQNFYGPTEIKYYVTSITPLPEKFISSGDRTNPVRAF